MLPCLLVRNRYFLSDERYHHTRESFSAATDHAKHLTDAQALVGDAMHLVRMMAEALGQEGDRRYTNLFLAYVDLNEKAEGDESN